MARFNEARSEDLERLVAEIKELPEALREAVQSKGLDAAGEIMAEEQRRSITKEDLIDRKGNKELLNSIVIKKKKGYVDVYPSGKRNNGERNEAVGFIHEYGRRARTNRKGKKIGAMQATRWMSKARKSAEETIHEAITDIFNEVLEKHGF